MKIKSAIYFCSATGEHGYPESDFPEVAFVGRSNVGKSSLINTLVNRKNLVKTSSSPGKTRMINFFQINDNLFLVDLPGYGFARVSAETKQQWGGLIDHYLSTRNNLKGIVQLIDIRHEPTSQDLQMYQWLKAYDFPNLTVATKADKISKGARDKQLKAIRKKLNLPLKKPIMAFSAKTTEGKAEILDWIKSQTRTL